MSRLMFSTPMLNPSHLGCMEVSESADYGPHSLLLRMQPAVAQMRSVFENPARMQSLQSCLPWLEILALVMRHQNHVQGDAACPMPGQSPKLDEALSEALRCSSDCPTLTCN